MIVVVSVRLFSLSTVVSPSYVFLRSLCRRLRGGRTGAGDHGGGGKSTDIGRNALGSSNSVYPQYTTLGSRPNI